MPVAGWPQVDWLTLLGALLAVNGLTIIAFREDKRRAMAGEWRISEGNLLLLALIGGTPGAYAARHTFRHKTRKQPFSTMLHLIALAQLALIAWIATKAI